MHVRRHRGGKENVYKGKIEFKKRHGGRSDFTTLRCLVPRRDGLELIEREDPCLGKKRKEIDRSARKDPVMGIPGWGGGGGGGGRDQGRDIKS